MQKEYKTDLIRWKAEFNCKWLSNLCIEELKIVLNFGGEKLGGVLFSLLNMELNYKENLVSDPHRYD